MISLFTPTAEDCIMAVIRSHGIGGVRVVRREADRIFCSDTDGLLEEYAVAKHASHEWTRELASTTKMHHKGALRCWREKDVSPALQIVESLAQPGEIELYARGKVYGCDLDFFAPQHAVLGGTLPSWRLFAHGAEVLRNKITGRKTSVAELARTPRIAALLKRFLPSP